MARHPRLIFPDVALHIIQRGVDRRDCFVADTDRLVYLSSLRQLASHKRCALHAYCLMTNHVHLLVTPRDAESCSALMRDLGQRYVAYFNRRHGRTGTLWEGRFRSCLVDSATYVIACYRYIERNPVRAGMVASPQAYPWSSYGANSARAADATLSPHAEYLALAATDAARAQAYRDLCGEPDEPRFLDAIRDATNAGYASLIGEELKAKLAASVAPA
ncbi:MAG: transposase [Betaproteobacteria bacterium]|nr:MAG: transposase [Betaproteobacteria bacterium]